MKRAAPQLFRRLILCLSAMTALLDQALAAGVQFGRAEAFAPYFVIPTGPRVGAVTIHDLNGDGRNDVAATTVELGDTNGNNLLIYLQDSQGRLQSAGHYNTRSQSRSLAAADFDSDGKPDIAVGLGGGIRVYLQRSGFAFELATNFVTFNSARICTGDFNNDGRSDIVGIGGNELNIDVYTQTADGTLVLGAQPPAIYDRNGDDVEAGDVNGDGLTDLVIMASLRLSVLIQTNGMLGSNYVAAVSFPYSTGVGVGDVTGDGRNDVVVALWGNRPNSKIAFVPQTWSGALTSTTTYGAYDLPEATVVADVDLDGYSDVVLAHDSWSRVGVFFGPALETEYLFPVLFSPFEKEGLAVGDINNDGMPDIVLGATDSRQGNPEQGLLILTNRLSIPPLRVSRISREPGGGVKLEIPYRGTRDVTVQASDTLTNWTTVGAMATKTWVDTNASLAGRRFYRLLSP